MSKAYLIIALLCLVIIIETGILLWKPVSIVDSFDDSQLRKDIEDKNQQIDFWQRETIRLSKSIDSLGRLNDSLESLEPEIIHHYHEIYRDINNSTNAKLDSIIRSNW